MALHEYHNQAGRDDIKSGENCTIYMSVAASSAVQGPLLENKTPGPQV